MTSAFSWQKSIISLCPASFCTPRPNLPITPGISWLPTFAFQSPIMKRMSFLSVSSSAGDPLIQKVCLALLWGCWFLSPGSWYTEDRLCAPSRGDFLFPPVPWNFCDQTLCVHSVTESCLALWDPMDYSSPGSSVHWVLPERILEWGAISSSRGSSWRRDQTHDSCISCIGRQFLNPAGLQSQILWGLLLPLLDPQTGKPNMGLRMFSPVR